MSHTAPDRDVLTLESVMPPERSAEAESGGGVVLHRIVRSPSISVFSTGGGTQSTAIAALIVQGKLPKPDYCIISDTGRENPKTWQYLNAVVAPALERIGLTVHRACKAKYGQRGYQEVFGNNGTLVIPAYTNASGEIGKLSAFCSDKWKKVVTNNFMSREHGLTRSKYCKWIGYSLDETKRVLKMQKGYEWRTGLLRFPLVHDVPMRRHECVKIVKAIGWPPPPRSRCWMCPHQSDAEWAEIKNDYPELFEQACNLDETMRQRDPNAYLHSTIKPLRDANLTAPDDLFSGGCPSGECFL